MDTINIGNLRDLVGGWSCLAFALGLGSAFLSYLSSGARILTSAIDDQGKIIGVLPWAMWLLAFFIGLFVLPASMAYSGPVPPEIREIWRYDKYFGTRIAFAFGVVFALDSLRFWKLRRQASTWLYLVLYLGTAWLLVARTLFEWQ